MQKLRNLKLNSWITIAAVATAAIAVSSALNGVRAQVQTDGASPDTTTAAYYAELQYATLTGSTNTINATRVPLVTSSGMVYKNLTFKVTVASDGSVTIVPGSPTAVSSPATQAAGFKAGNYAGPNFGSGSSYNGMLVTISGPGVTAGGSTEWSLSQAAGATATCPYVVSATWYVGSPTSVNNPLAARLKAAGITSTAYSYGTLGQPSSCNTPNDWLDGSLIGVSQTGNAITVSSFSGIGGDHKTPLDQITFTLK